VGSKNMASGIEEKRDSSVHPAISFPSPLDRQTPPARPPSPGGFRWPHGGTLLFLFLVLVIYWRPMLDLDFAWQIRSGGEVVRTGSLRTTDSFSYTIAGKQLPDFEWLYEVMLWAVWNVAGYPGLHLLKTFIVLAALGVLTWRLRREGVARHMTLGALILAILVMAWNLRPLYATTIGLLLLSGWLRDHCTGRRPLSWEVPLLMLLWSNTHPGVITGQGLLAGAIACEWLNRWLRLAPPLDRKACWRLTLFGGLGVLASLVCPDPLARLQYTFNPDLTHPIMRAFDEMKPTHYFVLHPPYLGVLLYLLTPVVLLTVVLRFRHYRLWELALLGGLILLASFAVRSLQDCLLIMLALGIPQLAALFRDTARRQRRLPRPQRSAWFARLLHADRGARRVLASPLFIFQPLWVLSFLLLLSVFSLTPALAANIPRKSDLSWAGAAMNHIDRAGLHGRFFSNPNYGSSLVWKLGPERVRCYVDTRGFFFPPYLLEDSLIVPLLAEGWRPRLKRILDKGTDYFLLETNGPPGALWRSLEGHVTPLYQDGETVLIPAAQVRSWLEQQS
jgi:hypothetical protein